VEEGTGGEIEGEFAMMACRYIMAGWIGWRVLSEIIHHGEPREGVHDGAAMFFGACIMIMLLAGGGFWG